MEKSRENVPNNQQQAAGNGQGRDLVIKKVINGEQGTWHEIKEQTGKILQHINVNINMKAEVDELRRIAKHKAGRYRSILLKLTPVNKNLQILKETKALRGTDIWIEEDYTKHILEEKKLLIPELKETRKKDHKR
ncbi:hypothetical protein ILUMI_11450 [Ignelater luminosus]|uniref:Uncharacterized protein n=1 Tax=Ignelater luminosus TaxID=2038154 RepID=A0A8K0D043_IGNLU|nr:hypothetical protein ILUMI_11450 [Ignelater luminosus]